MDGLLIANLIVSSLVAILAVIVLRRLPSKDAIQAISGLKDGQDRIGQLIRDETQRVEKAMRDEFPILRKELSDNLSNVRTEIGNSLKNSADSVSASVETLRKSNSESHESLRKVLEEKLLSFEKSFTTNVKTLKEDSSKSSADLQKQVVDELKAFKESTLNSQKDVANSQKNQFDSFSKLMHDLTTSNEGRFDKLRQTLESKMQDLQTANDKKLEEMRHTVDEKLQGTLEKRLGESFKLVSDRLEQVQKGLGEMQTLAIGVGDLKKVLTNVKSRGIWAEYQLAAILEDMLTPDQYAINTQIRPRSPERVEFAIRLPGKDESEATVLLPIDSKFPREDYERLVHAQENANAAAAAEAAAALEAEIRRCARDIREKYIHPPHSTDFAILYLPFESLFAEVLKRPGLVESLQQEFRVTIAGPTTLCALLNSLQMGFRTLAVQKRSSEVWKILGAVKSEFGKFGEILEKVGKQLETAQKTIGDASSKSKRIHSKLRTVEEVPAAESALLLGSVEESSEVTADSVATQISEPVEE